MGVDLDGSEGDEPRSRLEDFIEHMLSENQIEEDNRDLTFELGITENEAIIRINAPPFEEAINHLRQVLKYRRPIDKMRVIGQCNR